eukprot:CAMPEP_0113689074 /NCGR_PEP_ID=MMETSP0038_2-20120614/16929_1 /TAXON_ID=2898 /ORGANISM="Cryptomonas paramecium" /LENGTH=185 /DNA_ID=CAMNT_0000610039 /DNA_START=107 /DNA_END=664 /DNA_ORIENTATION=+ /assembly_acc=CAM_ASM_000170
MQEQDLFDELSIEDSDEFEGEFHVGHDIHSRRRSSCESARSNNDTSESKTWYQDFPINWCGSIKKKDRNALGLTVWRRRWFELRQPFLRVNSTLPILIYHSKSKHEKVMRVKDAKLSTEGHRQAVLIVDVVDCSADIEVDNHSTRQIVLLVSEESQHSGFHTVLLMMIEAARRFRMDLECGALSI